MTNQKEGEQELRDREAEQSRKDTILYALGPDLDVFVIDIRFNTQHPIYLALTPDERLRTEQKLTLVREEALRLAIAMLKGTVKYPTDNRTVREWVDFAIDDAGDAYQYLHFIKERLAKEEQDREDSRDDDAFERRTRDY